MEATKLNLLLMGKTGHGKSATGNTILGSRVFKTLKNGCSVTEEVSFNFAQFERYTLLVVDGPGLDNTDMDEVQDKISAAKNMDTALAMCYGGVDAFLLVIKVENRLTHEDRDVIDVLKRMFGGEFLEHTIVVVIGGDSFQDDMKYQGDLCKCFHEWCSDQRYEVLKNLYKDCSGRFVLFNNYEQDDGKKRAQVQEVVQLAENLQKHRGRYTSQCFEAAKYEREKFILTLRAPQLEIEFHEKIRLLFAAIEDLAARPSDDLKEKIRARVLELRNEIDQQDQGYDVLKELKKNMMNVEQNLKDVEQVITLGKERENTSVLRRIIQWFTN